MDGGATAGAKLGAAAGDAGCPSPFCHLPVATPPRPVRKRGTNQLPPWLCAGRRMLVMSKIVLPYEPDYVGHREAEKRRQETKEWLQHASANSPSGRRRSCRSGRPSPTRSAEEPRAEETPRAPSRSRRHRSAPDRGLADRARGLRPAADDHTNFHRPQGYGDEEERGRRRRGLRTED